MPSVLDELSAHDSAHGPFAHAPAHDDPQSYLNQLIEQWVVLPEEWDELPPAARDEILQLHPGEDFLDKLARNQLLTSYQADAIRRGCEGELVLGHYRLLEPIGQGGMGTVYRGEHLHLRRQVAVKVMTRTVETNARLLHRFYGEARSVAKLQHPNIVACTDAGRHIAPGMPPRDYYVMELIPGQDLHEIVRTGGALPPDRVCDLFRQIAEALAEAHRLGLVHRDIKPGNILITPDWQAKLLDFGLALHPQQRMTEPGTLLGTVGYMAPEQARDSQAVDARADIFSLGATMCWALTGTEPYPETGNVLQDLTNRLSAPAVDIRRARPELPAELAAFIAKLTDPDPAQRHQSARVVAAGLAALGQSGRGDPRKGDPAAHAADPSAHGAKPSCAPRTQAAIAKPAIPPALPLALGMTRLLEELGLTTRGYHRRVGRYVHTLAVAAPDRGEYARLKDPAYLDILARVAPAHDVGMATLPLSLLMKPERFDAEDRATVQQHTLVGGDILADVVARLPSGVPDLGIAEEIVRHHHERWDGEGYPDGLAGDRIPLSARVVAIVSVYEALRSRRPQRPAFNKQQALRLMTAEAEGQFDPTLLTAFVSVAAGFDEIFQSGDR
jgi:hypothetical protein